MKAGRLMEQQQLHYESLDPNFTRRGLGTKQHCLVQDWCWSQDLVHTLITLKSCLEKLVQFGKCGRKPMNRELSSVLVCPPASPELALIFN